MSDEPTNHYIVGESGPEIICLPPPGWVLRFEEPPEDGEED